MPAVSLISYLSSAHHASRSNETNPRPKKKAWTLYHCRNSKSLAPGLTIALPLLGRVPSFSFGEQRLDCRLWVVVAVVDVNSSLVHSRCTGGRSTSASLDRRRMAFLEGDIAMASISCTPVGETLSLKLERRLGGALLERDERLGDRRLGVVIPCPGDF